MVNNYKTIIGTFKSLKHFSDKGMLIGQNDFNDDFYDVFAGDTCEFAVFEYGAVFHIDTKIQVNPEDIDFNGCWWCDIQYLYTDMSDGYNYAIDSNYCPMCGRKLKIDE